jgi:hypothetical protein
MVSTDPATLAKVRRAIEEHGIEGAHVMLRDSLLRSGATRETAEEVSARDVARAQMPSASPADLTDGMAGAPQTPVGDDLPMRDPYPGAGRPGYDRTFTPQELAAAPEPTQGYQRVPAPRMPFGGPVPEPGVITNPEEIEAYTTREWDGARKTYKPSAKDRAMAARGLVPVLNPDGSVGHSVGYTQGSIVEDEPNRFPGSPGRAGQRKDLEAKGWVQVPVDSPLGPQTVYRPGATAQSRYDAQADQRAKERIAKRAGVSGAEAEGMTLDQLRGKAHAARIDDANSRRDAWKAQTMLAGGQPTGGRGGTKAITNALMMLPEDERNQSLRYMLPGGQLAAAVDAQNMQNANDVIKRFMTSGAAAGMNNPLAAAQAQAAQQQVDAAKPVQVRAQEHVAAGQLNHPDVFQHADDIVNTHYSSRPGMLGVSSRFTDNEVMLGAQRLADDTGMPIAEAEKIMRRIQADRNRNSVASSIVAGFYDQ